MFKFSFFASRLLLLVFLTIKVNNSSGLTKRKQKKHHCINSNTFLHLKSVFLHARKKFIMNEVTGALIVQLFEWFPPLKKDFWYHIHL